MSFREIRDTETHFGPSWIWQEIISRIYTLGALLIKNHNYDLVSQLAFLNIRIQDREILLTSHTRRALLKERRLNTLSLCPFAVKHIQNTEYFSSKFLGSEDRIIESVCQYDFFQDLLLLNANKNLFPNFGAYYNYRTEPIVSELVQEFPVREAISGISDERLAKLIYTLDDMAAHEFFSFGGWDRNDWSDPKIKIFLQNNLPDNPRL